MSDGGAMLGGAGKLSNELRMRMVERGGEGDLVQLLFQQSAILGNVMDKRQGQVQLNNDTCIVFVYSDKQHLQFVFFVNLM